MGKKCHRKQLAFMQQTVLWVLAVNEFSKDTVAKFFVHRFARIIARLKHQIPFITDLVPRENVEAWLKYLKNELPVVTFKASTQSQNENLVSL